eukprot:scpid47496/ scgid4430/ 
MCTRVFMMKSSVLHASVPMHSIANLMYTPKIDRALCCADVDRAERALPVTSATAQPPPKALSPSTSKQLTEARPTTRLVARRSDSTSVPAALTVSTAASMAGTPDVSSSANSSGTTVDDSGRGGLSPGAIALLAAASALCIAAAVAWFLCYKNRRGQRSGLLGSNRTPMIMLDDEEPLIAMQPDHAEPSAVITENEYTLDPTARVSSS